MAFSKYIATIVLALASFKIAVANPIVSYPEVIPGPGLPSLASLNLTTAMLYEMETDFTATPNLHPRAALFDPRCGPDEPAYTNVNGIIACYHFLDALGTQSCVAANSGTTMCTSGNAKVTGTSIPSSGASSYCRDVASGALWVINSCTRPDQSCAGFAAAYGNGNLIVGGTNVRW